jgi:regulator of nonsense transcripts 2
VQQDLLDPPEDVFRIRMIVTLLQTCGHYFDRGSSKRKLDSFLLYFQRYVLNKGPLPLDVEFDVQVSPPLNISSSIEVASLKLTSYKYTCKSSLYVCSIWL